MPNNNPLIAYEPIGGGSGWTIYPIESKKRFVEMVNILDEHNQTKTYVGRAPLSIIPMILLGKTGPQYVNEIVEDLIYRSGIEPATMLTIIPSKAYYRVSKAFGRIFSMLKLKEAGEFTVPITVFDHDTRRVHPGQTRMLFSTFKERNQWIDIIYTTKWTTPPPTGVNWVDPIMFDFAHGYDHLTMLTRPMADKFPEPDPDKLYTSVSCTNEPAHFIPEDEPAVLHWTGDVISFNGQPVFKFEDNNRWVIIQ